MLVGDGDAVSVTYVDADDGQGGTNVNVVATAVVDCLPPVISNVNVINIGPHEATITFDTDEPTNNIISFGTDCGSLTESAFESGYRTAHSIRLPGIDEDTSYFLAIDSEDQAGNAAADNNGGSCYTFDTPDIPDFFTEEFTGDFDLAGMKVICQPNGSFDYYAQCVEAITELPTDPSGRYDDLTQRR